ncbi:MAG: hypothetical protein MAGBODY4_01492 [Candidatus Marinimicrobia bacterium]|nr:hypothetical protein [Candidatus Neomarinimicrobiota bacterium]
MRTLLKLTPALFFLLRMNCSFYGTQRGPNDWHTIQKPSYE